MKQQVIYQYRDHTDHVEGISWSPDGKYIVSCDQTSNANATATVQIWDPQNGNTLFTYREHKNGVYSVAWSPDSTAIASVGYDGMLRIWDALSGKTFAAIPGSSPRRLYAVAWSRDGQSIVFGGDDCIVWLTDRRGSQLIPIYSLPSKTGLGVRDIVYSPKGNYYAASTDGQGVFIFHAVANYLMHHYTIQDIPGDISALGWSPSQPEIAMGNSTGVTSYSVQLWKTLLDE